MSKNLFFCLTHITLEVITHTHKEKNTKKRLISLSVARLLNRKGNAPGRWLCLFVCFFTFCFLSFYRLVNHIIIYTRKGILYSIYMYSITRRRRQDRVTTNNSRLGRIYHTMSIRELLQLFGRELEEEGGGLVFFDYILPENSIVGHFTCQGIFIFLQENKGAIVIHWLTCRLRSE